MEEVSTVHLVGPDASSEEKVKPLGRSSLERGKMEGLESVGILMGLKEGMSKAEKQAAEACCNSLLLQNWMAADPISVVQEMFSVLN